MELQEIHQLIDRYLAGTASTEERRQLEDWYESIDGAAFNGSQLEQLRSEMKTSMLAGIAQRSHAGSVSMKPLKAGFSYLKWAAVLFIGIGSLFYYMRFNNRQSDKASEAPVVKNDLSPGGNKAVLTLGDGTKVVLNDAADGQLNSKVGVKMSKEAGILTYSAAPVSGDGKLVYNTITTPKGGNYTIVLSDGTKVWLNAASTLKYPAAFKGTERKVELSGEAYFEVARNTSRPFRVKSEKQTIEVLGTHFNVNTYPEEDHITTTLLEGSVKVIGKSNEALLKPGQQAAIANRSLANQETVIKVHTVNTDEVIAWKNGWFQFEDADIKTVMNQIGRWYDVDIVYQGKISEDHYKGKVSKNVNISQVLKILEISGIKFKIEGKSIIVK